VDALLKPPGGRAGIPAGGSSSLEAQPQRVVWERAADLAVELFHLAGQQELLEPALSGPLRAAALAVPTFLARAMGRGGLAEARGQLIQALGALAEVESHLAMSERLRGTPPESLAPLRARIELVRRLIVVLGARPSAAPVAPARLDPNRAIR
jgi:four helix bundle protein